MWPMLGREVVKSKQDFFIFLQAFAGFWELDLVTWRETDQRLAELLCESAPGTFHGSVASLCPEHSWAFYPGCWPSYEPSNVAGRLGHILPAERSRSPAIH